MFLLSKLQVLCGRPKPDSFAIVHRILRDSDLSKRNHKGQTIAFEALKQGNSKEFLLDLLHYGVDLAARDYVGRTVRDLAESLELDKHVACIDAYIFEIMRNKDVAKLEDLVLKGYNHITDILMSDDPVPLKLRDKFDDDRFYRQMGKYVESIPKIQVYANNSNK